MPNRETWNFSAMEIGKPVKMQLLFDLTARNEGSKKRDDGSVFIWHSYPIEVEGREFMMFTPDEDVHQALKTAGVHKKGDTFTMTQQPAKNPATGKMFSYYIIDHNGTRVSSLDVGKPDTLPAQGPESLSGASETDGVTSENQMLDVWQATYAWITEGLKGELTDQQKISLKQAIVKDTTTIVNTRVMST